MRVCVHPVANSKGFPFGLTWYMYKVAGGARSYDKARANEALCHTDR